MLVPLDDGVVFRFRGGIMRLSVFALLLLAAVLGLTLAAGTGLKGEEAAAGGPCPVESCKWTGTTSVLIHDAASLNQPPKVSSHTYDWVIVATDLVFEASSSQAEWTLVGGKIEWTFTGHRTTNEGPSPCEYDGEGELDAAGAEGTLTIDGDTYEIAVNDERQVTTTAVCTGHPNSTQNFILPDWLLTGGPEPYTGGALAGQFSDDTPQTGGSISRDFEWSLSGDGLTVNSEGDLPDVSAGDGFCDTGETVVVGVDDVAECTLRAAIQEANANETGKRITFGIPGGNLPIIAPESALPTLAGGVDIDGGTQPVTGLAGPAATEGFVQINGSGAGGASGLVLEGLGNRVRNLVIADFAANGILINGGSGHIVQNNIIGTDHAGTPMPNNETGIKIDDSDQNLIGGEGENEGNIIANSLAEGVFITGAASTGNVMAGNMIGVNSAGERAANATGVYVLDAHNNTIGPGNVISGNTLAGVHLIGAGSHDNTVKGNKIGTNIQGTAVVGNGGDGVLIENGSTNFVGGLGASANVIAGNNAGVAITGVTATDNIVSGNYIGTDAEGRLGLGNEFGVTITNAPENFIGGTDNGEGNVIGGNDGYGVAIIDALSTENRVLGNFIGTDPEGVGIGNHDDGVLIEGASSNRIGGVGDGNVISGNGGDGVEIHSAQELATNNKIVDNLIGLKPNGADPLQNAGNGVYLAGAPGNTVGGTEGEGNVISGSILNGVRIAGEEAEFNSVSGNYIGIEADGNGVVGNHENGVLVDGAPSNRIGDPDSLTGRNVISGNGGDGVFIRLTASTGNVLRNNVIGSDDGGEDWHPNGHHGVHIAAALNIIGGTDESRPAKCSGVCNLIAGNRGDGVFIDGTASQAGSNLVSGNAIGLRNTIDCMGNPLDESQACDNGNAGAAVRISGNAPGNHIGGRYGLSLATFCTGDCNLMAFNGGGVVIEGDQATLNNVQSNYLMRNGDLAIDLGGDGPTINDDEPPTGNDQDNGPNMRQNFPRIEVAGEKGSTAWVFYKFRSTPSSGFTVDVYGSVSCPAGSRPAEMHLGYHSITTDASGERTASVDVSLAQLAAVDIKFITVTATDADGNTSEPSPCVALQPLTYQLQADVAAGNTVLFLDGGRGITVGDLLEIGAGPVQENAIVQWFQNNANPQSAQPGGVTGVMVTLEAPLQFSHPTGTSVTNLGPTATPTPTPTPSGEQHAWGDVDCSGSVGIGDAQKLARTLIGLSVTQGQGCPTIGSVQGGVGAAGVGSVWGDVDCSGSVTIGDAQKIARSLIGLPVNQTPPCPEIGVPT